MIFFKPLIIDSPEHDPYANSKDYQRVKTKSTVYKEVTYDKIVYKGKKGACWKLNQTLVLIFAHLAVVPLLIDAKGMKKLRECIRTGEDIKIVLIAKNQLEKKKSDKESGGENKTSRVEKSEQIELKKPVVKEKQILPKEVLGEQVVQEKGKANPSLSFSRDFQPDTQEASLKIDKETVSETQKTEETDQEKRRRIRRETVKKANEQWQSFLNEKVEERKNSKKKRREIKFGKQKTTQFSGNEPAEQLLKKKIDQHVKIEIEPESDPEWLQIANDRFELRSENYMEKEEKEDLEEYFKVSKNLDLKEKQELEKFFADIAIDRKTRKANKIQVNKEFEKHVHEEPSTDKKIETKNRFNLFKGIKDKIKKTRHKNELKSDKVEIPQATKVEHK